MRRALLAWSLLAVMAGCRSGGGPAVRPATEPPPDFVQAYVGQRRILLHAKEEVRVAVSRGETARKAPACSSAVEVKRATLAGGALRMDLDHVGRAAIDGKPAAACGAPPATYALTLSGLGAGDGADAVEESLANVLVTPEAFLTARGHAFDRAPVGDPGVAASRDVPGSTAEERSLGRKVTAWPKTLLTVNPELLLGRKDLRRESEVEFAGVVGPDGRLHRVKVTTPLSASHVALVERALALWRFEPAAAPDGPVAAKTAQRTAFRIY